MFLNIKLGSCCHKSFNISKALKIKSQDLWLFQINSNTFLSFSNSFIKEISYLDLIMQLFLQVPEQKNDYKRNKSPLKIYCNRNNEMC